MGFDINGKTALVTGANRGIGKAIVEAFVREGAAKVYAAVRKVESAAALTAQHGEKVVAIRMDLADPASIDAAAAQFGDVELVVNNAGILRGHRALSEEAIDTLKAEMEVNVYGLLRVARAFAPALKANGGGAFVQLNSVASLKCFADFATYCASKAASYAMTQGLREQLGAQGTVVLSVHPGPIATDMAADAGFIDSAEPPQVVADGIVEALKAGRFHLFPDSFARAMGEAYQGFAEAVIESGMVEEA